MPSLFGLSGHGLSRWGLYWWFKHDPDLGLEDPDERMSWGVRLQEPILQRVAYEYRGRMLSNTEKNIYVRRGRIGHTRDGRLIAAGRGRINVEAKNVDYMIWKSDWTETAAPQHIEIQAEVGTYVDRCDLTIIAALIGGNKLKLYERTPRPEFHGRMKDETLLFFDDLKNGREPDPMGAIEADLPMLARLYPEPDPAKVLERLEDAELRDLLRQFRYGRDQIRFGQNLVDQARPKILAIAQDCSIIRANGIEAAIRKELRAAEEAVDHEVLFAAQAVRAWARAAYTENVATWPRELRQLDKVLRSPWVETRKESISQFIDTFERYGDPALPGDDIVQQMPQEIPA
jgi:hypothetical protein